MLENCGFLKSKQVFFNWCLSCWFGLLRYIEHSFVFCIFISKLDVKLTPFKWTENESKHITCMYYMPEGTRDLTVFQIPASPALWLFFLRMLISP